MNVDRDAGSDEPSPLHPECRARLRAGPPEAPEVDPHAENCPNCAAFKAALELHARLVRAPIEAPAELASAAFLERLRERIAADAEASPVGRLLAKAMPVTPPAALAGTFPESLLSPVGRDRLADHPVLPDDRRWDRVRSNILGDIGSTAALRRGRFRIAAMAGVAAAAIVGLWLSSEGTRSVPRIVIADVESSPSVGFSPMVILRRGSDR